MHNEPTLLGLDMVQIFFWMGFGLLLPQALWVRRRATRFEDAAGEPAGQVAGPDPVRLIAIGDSIIAGVGCRTLEQACVGQTALQLSKQLGRGVTWVSLGRTGATTGGILRHLIPQLPEQKADFILISAGVNDMTALKKIPEWIQRLSTLIQAMKMHSPDAIVVMLGIPPLGRFPRLPQPLRALFGLRARGFDKAAATLLAPLPNVVYVPFDHDLQP
ncbi:MAG: SGNH/GDSL hydrolase family protein, partial [Wenzhouxiangella sp.]|nr:SGNH/GDSL hydrolase family protein [Wenzhouxiangella sp.]